MFRPRSAGRKSLNPLPRLATTPSSDSSFVGLHRAEIARPCKAYRYKVGACFIDALVMYYDQTNLADCHSAEPMTLHLTLTLRGRIPHSGHQCIIHKDTVLDKMSSSLCLDCIQVSISSAQLPPTHHKAKIPGLTRVAHVSSNDSGIYCTASPETPRQ